MEQEEVMSVNIKDFPNNLSQGFSTANMGEITNVLSNGYYFAPRDEAEYNFDAKQIIPYIVLKSRDCVLLVKRFKTQGEKRLHDKYSIGLGGHINPGCSDFFTILDKGIMRELHEELHLQSLSGYRLAGVLNDDTTEVSKVHLGLVYITEVDKEKVSIRETDKMKGEFVPISSLPDYSNMMESWSRILVENKLFMKLIID